MNSIATKILTAIAGLLLLVYAGYQGYRYLYSPYKTEIAIDYVYNDVVSTRGIALRNETVLGALPSGVVNYMQPDAAKVSASTEIARVYSSESDMLLQTSIQEVEAQLQSLQNSQNLSGGIYANTEVLSNQIYEQFAKLLGDAASGGVETAPATRLSYLELLNRYQIRTGKEQNFNARTEYLNNRLAELKGSFTGTVQSIRSPGVGYFAQGADGMEKQVKASLVDEYTLADYKAMIAATPTEQPPMLGRMVEGINWYFAAVIPGEKMEQFYGLSTVVLEFNLPGVNPLTATVYRVLQDKDGQESVVVFHSRELYEGLINLRLQPVDIKLRTVRGVRVNSQAVRFVDAQPGVYVRNGFTVEFRPVRILYEEPSFVICEEGFGDKPIKQYDEVILEGEVYDGKTIDE